MRELVFEKVGDINYTYSYLCVYLRGDKEPFMEIGVTDGKELELTIYPRETKVVLAPGQWDEILQRARRFLPSVLADEE
jgi:hypothetical protein